MNNYLTRLTLSPLGSTVSFGSEKPNSPIVKSYNWSYKFSDGSRLVGTLKGQIDIDNNKILNPTKISADYIAPDGQTVIQSWKDLDFACFESNIDGQELVIVASNDNFVGNSMCLVESVTRTRAQVTNEGKQVIAEALNPSRWSFCIKAKEVATPTWEIDWQVLPMFPFLSVSVNWRLPVSSQVYQWTFFPYCFPFPFMEVARRVAS